MDEWTIYWITRCDGVRGAAVPVVILASFVAACSAVGVVAERCGDPPQELGAFAKKCLAAAMTVLLGGTTILAFLPTTKEMCAIVALPAIARNEDAQEIGREVVDLAKEWLSELKPAKETP